MGAVIRDVMYIDGGLLSFLRGMDDGTYNTVDLDQVPRQFLYYINFTQPFSISQNTSEIIHTISKPDNNLAPNFYDGSMFANDYELILYGGLLALTDSASAPGAGQIINYEKYQHFAAVRQNWAEGFYSFSLPSNVTRYITQGAGVSIPSENLAFYFSGTRASDWGEITKSVTTSGNSTADTLISVDMSTMRSEKWDNKTLPSQIPGRANAELVWIPVSTQGVLLAIGGVINPDDVHLPTDEQFAQSKTISPTFMQEIAIYDINNQKWYKQKTTGDVPGALTQFCSVVASAKDGSSHSVYIYGGYDGQKNPAYSDDVYVLSVPSFVWIKVYSGKEEHARVRHKCSKPYPDQMFVVGGSNLAVISNPTSCLIGGMIEIFNLNNLTWQTQYDPNVWSEYKIPSTVVQKIGGNADGGATAVSPASWDDNALPTLFKAKYSGSISTYYPYKAASTSVPPSHTPTPAPKSKGGIPSWVAPFLGVVLGLVAISAAGTCFMLYRGKRSEHGTSGGSQSGFQQGRLMNWLASTGSTKPSADVTSDGQSVSASSPFSPTSEEDNQLPMDETLGNPIETQGNPIYELDAPRNPIEMGAADTTQQPAMTQITPSDRRVSSPTISRRAVSSTYSVVSAVHPGHARTISGVSAATDPDRPSGPALAVMPEDDNPMGSPVSPPTDEVDDPLANAAQGQRDSRGAGLPTQRNQRDSPTRGNRESVFGERFD